MFTANRHDQIGHRGTPAGAVACPRVDDLAGRITAGVNFSPPDIARRRIAGWRGAAAEVVQIIRHERFEYLSSSPFHLLVASERVDQLDGEIELGGMLPLRFHRSFRKLTFVPAGHPLRPLA